MDKDDPKCDAPIRSAIGSLMYVMLCTRPDICNAVITLSAYASKCNQELWNNIKRVFMYLKGIHDLKLTTTGIVRSGSRSDMVAIFNQKYRFN